MKACFFFIQADCSKYFTLLQKIRMRKRCFKMNLKICIKILLKIHKPTLSWWKNSSKILFVDLKSNVKNFTFLGHQIPGPSSTLINDIFSSLKMFSFQSSTKSGDHSLLSPAQKFSLRHCSWLYLYIILSWARRVYLGLKVDNFVYGKNELT